MGRIDEGSGTEAVQKASLKRAASGSLVQHTAKRRAQVQANTGEGAAVAAAVAGDPGGVDGAGSHAAIAGAFGAGSSQTAVNGGSRRQMVLRIRK